MTEPLIQRPSKVQVREILSQADMIENISLAKADILDRGLSYSALRKSKRFVVNIDTNTWEMGEAPGYLKQYLTPSTAIVHELPGLIGCYKAKKGLYDFDWRINDNRAHGTCLTVFEN